MSDDQEMYIGIDVTTGTRPFTLAEVNTTGERIKLTQCALDEVIYATSRPFVWVAVNAPWMSEKARSGDLRAAVQEQKRTQQFFQASPGSPLKASSHAKNSRLLFSQLEQVLKPDIEKARVIKINATTCYRLLLDGQLLPGAGYEGRIQRQLALIRQGIRLKDPMAFYEEITRRRLLQGDLPDNMLYRPAQLNALVAACMARLARQDPHRVTYLGDEDETKIAIPRKID